MWETLVKFIRDIFKNNDLISDVYTFETIEYKADPFVTITPSANEGDYDTTIDNRRIYAFEVRIFKERGGETEWEDAERAMRELVDSVLDDLDKNWRLSGINVPAGYTFLFMDAAPAEWGYVERETALRVATINVKCHFNIDITVI